MLSLCFRPENRVKELQQYAQGQRVTAPGLKFSSKWLQVRALCERGVLFSAPDASAGSAPRAGNEVPKRESDSLPKAPKPSRTDVLIIRGKIRTGKAVRAPRQGGRGGGGRRCQP